MGAGDDERVKGTEKRGPGELCVELVPIGSLTLDEDNALEHNERNLETIGASLTDFEQQKPIVIDADGRVLAGNGTVMAAKQLGWSHVWVARSRLTGQAATEFAVVDNRSAHLARFDDERLARKLKPLSLERLKRIGFSEAERRTLLRSRLAPRVQEDEIPDRPAKPVTKPGQIWKLGDHRLMCGDATKVAQVKKLLGGKRCSLMFTDPPYGVRHGRGGSRRDPKNAIRGDITQAAIPLSFAIAIEEALDENARLYICGGHENVGMYLGLWDHHLHDFPRIIVWVKDGFVLRQRNYHSQFEVIYWGWKGTGGDQWFGDRQQSDVWQVARRKETKHGTEKPVELAARAIRNSCEPGGLIYESFAGSGSTLVAAEQLSRACFAMELDPGWCDVIVQRWSKLTGVKAKRAA